MYVKKTLAVRLATETPGTILNNNLALTLDEISQGCEWRAEGQTVFPKFLTYHVSLNCQTCSLFVSAYISTWIFLRRDWHSVVNKYEWDAACFRSGS